MDLLRPIVFNVMHGGLLGSMLLLIPVSASEKDELASTLRLITQVQASLERARVAATQEGQERYFFDYQRATSDLNAMQAGIEC